MFEYIRRLLFAKVIKQEIEDFLTVNGIQSKIKNVPVSTKTLAKLLAHKVDKILKNKNKDNGRSN